jgi:hypothetical protein
MAASGHNGGPRRLRLLLAWLLTALVVAVYFSLPTGDEGMNVPAHPPAVDAPNPPRIEVVGVTPADATPGSAVTVQFAGTQRPEQVQAFAGKVQLQVLSRLDDALVVRIPANAELGHLKVRVSDGGERSKAFVVRIKKENWRKPFRSLLGGFALLIFGIGVLARGAREAVGLRSTHVLARWPSAARQRWAWAWVSARCRSPRRPPPVSSRVW